MDSFVAWFLEPIAYPFMQNALLTALIVALICAVLSCYLVLKGWALMGGCGISCGFTGNYSCLFTRTTIVIWCILRRCDLYIKYRVFKRK